MSVSNICCAVSSCARIAIVKQMWMALFTHTLCCTSRMPAVFLLLRYYYRTSSQSQHSMKLMNTQYMTPSWLSIIWYSGVCSTCDVIGVQNDAANVFKCIEPVQNDPIKYTKMSSTRYKKLRNDDLWFCHALCHCCIKISAVLYCMSFGQMPRELLNGNYY